MQNVPFFLSQARREIFGMSKIFALVTFLICILNGCQMIREKASGPEFSINDRSPAKAQLAREDQATLQAVAVDVDDGVVKLKGTVNSAQKKAKAEEIARRGDWREERGQQPGGQALRPRWSHGADQARSLP